MREYISVWIKWVAITIVIATVLFFVGYHQGVRRASLQCALSTLSNDHRTEVGDINDKIVVYVVGEVVHPGVYELNKNARLVDAVHAAGGLTSSADNVSVNLAMKLTDGMKVYIPPKRGEDATALGKRVETKVNVNMATPSELESVPGIGPVLARRIVEYRNSHGPFSSYEDLLNVKGIGVKTLESIKPYIQVP